MTLYIILSIIILVSVVFNLILYNYYKRVKSFCDDEREFLMMDYRNLSKQGENSNLSIERLKEIEIEVSKLSGRYEAILSIPELFEHRISIKETI